MAEKNDTTTRVQCVACGEVFQRPRRRGPGRLTQRCDRCRVWSDYVKQSLATDLGVIGPGRNVARRNAEAKRDSDWRRFRTERRHVNPRMTVEQLAHAFLANLAERRRVSVADWAGLISRHIIPAFGTMRPGELDASDLVAFIELKRADAYAEMSIGNMVAVLRAMLEYARCDLGLIDRNAAREIPAGKRPSRKARDPMRRSAEVLTPAEARPLFSDPRLPFERRLLWTVLFLTGCRISECGGLEWRDLNRALRPLPGLTLARALHNKTGKVVPWTKDGTVKVIPVHAFLAGMLEEAAQWWGSAVGRSPEPTDPLVARVKAWREVGRWNERAAIGWLREDTVKVGIPDPPSGPRTLHSARHSFISNIIGAGVPELHARALTHVSSVVDRRDAFAGYVHMSHETLCRAVAALEVGR